MNRSRFLVVALLVALVCSMTLLLYGCGKSEEEVLEETLVLFSENEYKTIVQKSTENRKLIESAHILNQYEDLVAKAGILIDRGNTAMHKGDSLAALGLSRPAREQFEVAMRIFPKDSLLALTHATVAHGLPPVYTYRGTIGEREFKHAFHTKWRGDRVVPDFVNITVWNHDPSQPTALAYFVPSFFYQEVKQDGPHVFAVVAEPDFYQRKRSFSSPIWGGEESSGRVTCSSARTTNYSSRYKLEDVFEKIVLGKDNRFYVNMVGFQHAKYRGLEFSGYGDK